MAIVPIMTYPATADPNTASANAQAIESVAGTLESVSLRPSAAANALPAAQGHELDSAQKTREDGTPVRGTTVRMSVPLDAASAPTSSSAARVGTTTMVHGTRKLLRRDSLDRREALLKGKEGSRQRRRWENDRLLSNPYAEPPLPSDWEIRPTYPRRTIPYYLAPLWDAAEFQRAIESKLKGNRRNSVRGGRRHGKKSASGSHIRGDNVYEVGMSPMEEAASNIPKEIRARLKHARSAKGLLMDLEEDVRGFVKRWNEREVRLREEGLGDAPLPKSKSMPKERVRSENKNKATKETNSSAIETDEEEDEEIVFVGRNGAMHDMPSSPSRSVRSVGENVDLDHEMTGTDSTDPKARKNESGEADEDTSMVATEKCIFQSLSSDAGAGFARWLVHCVGSYYGLRTWSVTREIEGETRREAYVGVDARARGWVGGNAIGRGKCVDLDGNGSVRAVELPMPLWGMV